MGLGRRAIQHRADSGRLHRIHRGVYAVGGRSLTREGHWMVAVLACGEGAVLSHRTAAALHELMPSVQTKIDVMVPHARSGHACVRLHVTRLERDETTIIDGIPVTTVARTLADLASVLPRDRLLRAIEQADRLSVFDGRALERTTSRRRLKGIDKLRSILAAYEQAPPTRSELERDFLAMIERAGIPEPRVNTQVAGLEVDFCWPEQRLIVELDSRSYHTSPRAFEQDRIRDAKLQLAGYRVPRITYRRLHESPDSVLADVRALLRLAA